jgi:hypothetical protein
MKTCDCRDANFRGRFQASIVSVKRQGQKLSGKLGDISLRAGDDLLFDCGDGFDKQSDLVKNNLQLIGLVPNEEYREFMFAFSIQGAFLRDMQLRVWAG